MPNPLAVVLCQARVEHFETAEPELIPASWCKDCPDAIAYRPLEMMRKGCCGSPCILEYGRVPYIVCRYDFDKGGAVSG